MPYRVLGKRKSPVGGGWGEPTGFIGRASPEGRTTVLTEQCSGEVESSTPSDPSSRSILFAPSKVQNLMVGGAACRRYAAFATGPFGIAFTTFDVSALRMVQNTLLKVAMNGVRGWTVDDEKVLVTPTNSDRRRRHEAGQPMFLIHSVRVLLAPARLWTLTVDPKCSLFYNIADGSSTETNFAGIVVVGS